MIILQESSLLLGFIDDNKVRRGQGLSSHVVVINDDVGINL